MGKHLLLVFTFFLLGGTLALAGRFYWRNLRGLKPALQPPSQNITQVVNTTGMPLQLPPGFSISIYADNLDNARVLALDPQDTLLVSLTAQGKVVALPQDKSAITVIDQLNLPHGLAFRQGKLYIAETDQVAVYDYDPQTFKAANKKKITDLPAGSGHFTRTLLFTPDDKLLISVG